MIIHFDRDSVAAGDDAESHERAVDLRADATVGEFLDLIRSAGYLASIAGGRATWLVEVGGAGGRCVGVVAQEWEAPRLTVPAATPIASLLAGATVHFRYWCQADPEAVFEAVAAGRELPGRYGGGG